MQFPRQRRIGGKVKYRLSDVLQYEAAIEGQPIPGPLPAEDERWLGKHVLMERYDVSDMWLWRREQEARNREREPA